MSLKRTLHLILWAVFSMTSLKAAAQQAAPPPSNVPPPSDIPADANLSSEQSAGSNRKLMEALSRLSLRESVAEWEKFHIGKALEESTGNKAEAARRLGFIAACCGK